MRGALYAMHKSLGRAPELGEKFRHEVLTALADFAAVPPAQWGPMLAHARLHARSPRLGYRPTNAEILAAWEEKNSPDRGEEAYRRRVHREWMERQGKFLAAPGMEPAHPDEVPGLMDEVWRAAGLRREA